MTSRAETQKFFTNSCKVIPGGVNSPVRAFMGLDMLPLIADKGQGDQVFDVDGKSYIDYCMGWGSLMLGHAHPAVVDAAIKQMKNGSSFGIATSVEYEMAEFIISKTPSMEKIRFMSSGTEAVMTALRLARGYTERPVIIKFNGNYHGHADKFLVKAGSGVIDLDQEPSSSGVPADTINNTVSLPYNNIDLVQKIMRGPFYSHLIAAVVIEPIAGNMGVIPAEKDFLEMLREETERNGSLLVFDEVITGFRVGPNGAQGLYNIQPDLTCFGKIVGGGFPAAAVGGIAEIMDHLAPLGNVYQAGTLSGNSVAMQAGLATLKEISKESFFQDLEAKTNIITKPVTEALDGHVATLHQVGSMFSIFWGVEDITCQEDLEMLDQNTFKTFFQTLFNQGIYLSPSPYETSFVSSVHTIEHLEYTRDCILAFIDAQYKKKEKKPEGALAHG